MIEKHFKTRSEAGTLAIAQNIYELMLPTPRLVILTGDLGAGKTTLVKGIAQAMSAATPDEITSPTFTLVHEYVGPKKRLYHLDLYRLESDQQLPTLGIEEMEQQPDALVLVEWGEKFPSLVQRAQGQIIITHLEGDERAFDIRML